MKTLIVAAALLLAVPAATAATPASASQNPPATPVEAQAAEAALRALMASATGPMSGIDFDAMTPAVAANVRAYPEGADAVRAFGTATRIQFLGSPPGGHLFQIIYPSVQIDFFIALNDEGKISAMYFHPSTD